MSVEMERVNAAVWPARTEEDVLRILRDRQKTRLRSLEERLSYLADHPTMVVFLGDMAGKAMLWPLLENIPAQVVHFWPTWGGNFNLDCLELALQRLQRVSQHNVLVVPTFHYAQSQEVDCGCDAACFDARTQQPYARSVSWELGKRFASSELFVVPMAIETDSGRLLPVGEDFGSSEKWDVDCVLPEAPAAVRNALQRMLEANDEHVEARSGSLYPQYKSAGMEWFLALADPPLLEPLAFYGEGLLLSEGFVPDVDQVMAVEAAGKILLSNFVEQRVTGAPMLIVLATHGQEFAADLRKRQALQVLKERVPQLCELGLTVLAGTMDPATWKFKRVL